MKKVFKLLSGMLCTLAAFAVLSAATKVSADVKVETLNDLVVKDIATDENTYKTDNGLVINVKTTYPTVKISGHPVITKRVSDAIANFAVFDKAAVYSDSAKAEDIMGTDRVINIERDFISASFCGNIMSVRFDTLSTPEDSAYPTSETEVLNINIKTGRKVTLTSLFEDKAAAKNAIAKDIKAQMKAIVKAEGSILNPSAKKIAKEMTINNCMFSNAGVTVIFDETASFGIHAEGTVEYFVPYEVYSEYIKESKTQLFAPLSTVKYILSYNAGTGYQWIAEVADEKVARIVDIVTYADYDDPTLCGGPLKSVVTVAAVAEGKTTLSLKLARSWEPDAPADEQNIELIVAETLFITENNG